MDLPQMDDTTDYTEARNHMVDGQVRPNKVNDPRIVQAMRRLPRERFVPPGAAALAYSDEDVPLGGGRFLMEPMVIARLVQMLRVRAGERALVVAGGTGYGAALLAACGAQVTAIEDDPALLAIARSLLGEFAPDVVLRAGDTAQGVPWDAILIEGAVRAIPPQIAAQLGPNGRLATVVAPPAGNGYAVLAEPSSKPGELRAQPIFDCAIPLLPGFRPAPSFQF